MLSLNPPYKVIEGYTLLSDHADPGRWFVLPPSPRLAVNADGLPLFSLVQYLGGGAGAQEIAGGILTLTTELVVPDEVISRLRSRLAAGSGLSAEGIRVTPVLFDSGTVELIALGNTSASPSADPHAPPSPTGPFSVRFLGSGKPSLSGNNVATFQLMLGSLDAELIEQCLEMPDAPLIAIYRMTFAGLRPSFSINIEADWSKVYHSLQSKAQMNFYYVASNVDVMITQALEENHIKVDTTVFGTDDGARASAERARKQLMEWVTSRLFTPMTDPAAAMANAIGNVVEDTVSSLVRSVLPGISYRLRSVEEDELRTMSARMNESVAEQREIVPQGTLGGTLRRFQVDVEGRPDPHWASTRAKLVQKVNLDGFPRLEVKVATEDRFESDGLSEVQVELGRVLPDNTLTDTRTLSFRTAAEREDYLVNLLGQEKANFSIPYRYRTRVAFDPTGVFGSHSPVQSDWHEGNAVELFVEPRDCYAVREVQVGVTPTFSFSQFSAVTVELREAAAGEQSSSQGRIVLAPDKPIGVWSFRSFAPFVQPYEYRATYHRLASDGGDIETPWLSQVETWLSISDPLPTKRTLNLFFGLPWTTISVSFLQVRYTDEANNIHFEEQIDLSADSRYLRRDYAIAEGGSRTIFYRLTVMFNDGRLLEGSWRETEDDRLLIDSRLVERKVITVKTIGGTLLDNRLSEVRIHLEVRDPMTGQVREQTDLNLTADSPTLTLAPWEYLRGDPPSTSVSYSAFFVDANGFGEHTSLQSTTSDLLIVQLRNKSITG